MRKRAGFRRMLLAVICGAAAVVGRAAEDVDPEIERLLFRLNQGRGLSGPPVATTSTRRVEDPRAVEVAGRLAGTRLSAGLAGRAEGARKAVAAPVPAGLPGADFDVAVREAGHRRLLAVAGPGVEVYVRSENLTVRQIRHGVLERSPRVRLAQVDPRDQAEATARAFLRANAGLLRIRDADREFGLERSEPDGLGGRHLRFGQRHGEVPVWPASVSIHLDARGDVVQFDGAYVPTPVEVDVAGAPTVGGADAVLRAKAAVPGGMRGEAGEPELLVFAPIGGEARRAWRVALNVGFRHAWQLVIDAETGRVLRRSNRVYDAGVAGSGRDLAGVTRALNVWQAGNTHYLIDTSKPMFRAGSDPVQQPQGAITIADARLKKVNDLKGSDLFLISSANPNAWEVPDGGERVVQFFPDLRLLPGGAPTELARRPGRQHHGRGADRGVRERVVERQSEDHAVRQRGTLRGGARRRRARIDPRADREFGGAGVREPVGGAQRVVFGHFRGDGRSAGGGAERLADGEPVERGAPGLRQSGVVDHRGAEPAVSGQDERVRAVAEHRRRGSRGGAPQQQHHQPRVLAAGRGFAGGRSGGRRRPGSFSDA
jgi:hypothetical protein